MSSTRQDAWTHDEDLLLAEVVLRHIRDGGTQLQAFEEVGKQMNRTAAACGFRWNSYVRKQYKSGIEFAKKQRKERKGNLPHQEVQEVPQSSGSEVTKVVKESKKLHLNEVIKFLQDITDTQVDTEKLAQENIELRNQANQLQRSLANLSQSYEKQKKEYHALQQEYSSMIAILERARKMAVLHEK